MQWSKKVKAYDSVIQLYLGELMRVLYAEAVYGKDEISAALNVLENQAHSLMTSENVLKLENKVSDLFGHTYGIMVNSGSSANLLALQSLELPEKSEVITPALTFATTLAPIVQSNLVPVFIDCKENTFNIDTELIEAQITPRTRALMIPNLIGNVANLPEIKKIAEKNKLIVIEDSADTIGHTINNEKTGNFSDISTTSFYASHIITGAGFGGMVVTSNDKYRKNCQLLRGWGRDSSIIGETENIDTRTSVFLEDIRYDAKFIFSKLGYNFLPSEISAAFALVQAGKLQQNIEQRIKNFDRLQNIFGEFKDFFITPERLPNSRSPWLAYPFTIKDNNKFNRSEFQIYLEKNNIQTRTVFTGNALKHPAFSKIESVKSSNGYPESDRVMRNGILIGLHNGLNDDHLDYVENTLKNYIKSM
jgi:CDP-6-deoxy-D-xylo-4-hexulose-3-dehydrase